MADRRLPSTHAAPERRRCPEQSSGETLIDRQSSPPASATSLSGLPEPARTAKPNARRARSAESCPRCPPVRRRCDQFRSPVPESNPDQPWALPVGIITASTPGRGLAEIALLASLRQFRSVPARPSLRSTCRPRLQGWTARARSEALEGQLIGAAVETTVWTSPDRPRCLPERSVVRFLDVDDRRTTSERRASFVGRPDAHEQLCHGIGLRQPEGFRLAGATPREPAAGDWLARGSHPIQTGRRCPPGRPESSGG